MILRSADYDVKDGGNSSLSALLSEDKIRLFFDCPVGQIF